MTQMAKPSTRYLRGMFDLEMMSPAQLERLNGAVAILEKLHQERAITFVVVSNGANVSSGGRKPRKDRKPLHLRQIGPTERRAHRRLLDLGTTATTQEIADHLSVTQAVARTVLHNLRHRGFTEQIDTGTRNRLWRATSKIMPAY